MRHGTTYAYKVKKCRCELCVAWRSAESRAETAKKHEKQKALWPKYFEDTK